MDFIKKNWLGIFIIIAFGIMIAVLVDLTLTVNEMKTDKLKNEIKAIDNQIQTVNDKNTAVSDNLSNDSKQAVKRADNHKAKAHEKSIVADTTRSFKFSYLTRK